MMAPRILFAADFVTTPWKNGGGITHEIARDGADPWLWRISLAEVASDGPFSRFEGMARILTVIEGAGLDLATSGGVLQARARKPLAFSGDLAVDSRMVDGPVRDLNVIYDARRVVASVQVVTGPWVGQGSALGGVYALTGGITLADAVVPPGAFGAGVGMIVLADQSVGVVMDIRLLV